MLNEFRGTDFFLLSVFERHSADKELATQATACEMGP